MQAGCFIDPVRRVLSCVHFLLHTAWETKKIYFLYLILSAMVNTGLTLNTLFFPKYILDSLYPHPQISSAFLYAGIMIGLSLILSLVQNEVSEKITLCNLQFNQILNRRLYEKTVSVRFIKLEDPRTLDDLASAKKGIAETGIPQTANLLLGLLSNLITICSVLWVISRLSIFILLLALAVSSINAVVNVMVERRRYQYHLQSRATSRRMYITFWNMVFPEYGKEVRLFHLTPFCEKHFWACRKWIDHQNDEISILNMKTGFFSALAYGIQVFLVYWYISDQLIGGQITVGDFSLYISSVLQFSALFSSIVTSVASLFTQSQYMNCLKRFLQQEDGFPGEASLPTEENPSIEFDHVSFCYPGQDREAIQDLSLVITDKESVSIVGPNGAGKTTFVKLLMGLYPPSAGTIRINGKDLETLKPKETKKLFSTVFQDFHILNYTLGENIAMNTVWDHERIDKAVDQAGFTDRVARLPKAYETFMTRTFDEQGVELSGGEQQKLAISRAFYRDAPVIILDEPTAALSPQAEDELYKRVNQLSGRKTILFISHRLSSCRMADRILVFDGGRLIEQGPHESLMKQGGLYSTMFHTQAQNYQEEGDQE